MLMRASPRCWSLSLISLTGTTDEAIATIIVVSQDLKRWMQSLQQIYGEEGPEPWQDNLAP
jgi:hypothetical protein